MKKLLLITVSLINFASIMTNGRFIFDAQTASAQVMATEDNSDYGFNSGGNGITLPDVIVTGQGNNNDSFGEYLDLWNNLNGLHDYIEGGDACDDVIITAPYPNYNAADITGDKPDKKNETIPSDSTPKSDSPGLINSQECDNLRELIKKSKDILNNGLDKLLAADSLTIGKSKYISFQEYVNIVRDNPDIEHTSCLNDYSSEDGYGTYLSLPDGSGTNNEDQISISTYHSDGSPNLYTKLIIHNHPTSGHECVSPQDIICLLGYHLNGVPNLNSIVAWNGMSTAYSATVIDENKAKVFYEKYKNSVDKDHNWDNKVFEKYLKNHKDDLAKFAENPDFYYNDIEGFRMQLVLDHFDSGVIITRFDLGAGSKSSENNNATLFYTRTDNDGNIIFIQCS